MSLVDQVEVESRPSREVEFYPRPTIFLQFRALVSVFLILVVILSLVRA